MRISSTILSLPTSLLLLLAPYTLKAEHIQESDALESFPKHARYWPEDPPHRRRDLEALQSHIKRGDNVVGVMKMSPDPGEKFFPEYWQYEEAVEQSREEALGAKLRRRDEDEENRLLANVSMAVDFRAPFAIHDATTVPELKARAAIGRSAAALAALEKRQFRCIVGTNSCAAIGYQNSCCPEGETCFQIQDTGLGPVGCCPNGRACSGTISTCNAPNTPCSSELGGGCCIPGFACQGVGCVVNIITTVLVTPTVPSTSTTSTRTTTSAPPPPVSSPSITTTSSPPPATQPTLTCRSDSNPCPASLGGGCCHTDRVCASSGICAYPPGSSPPTTSTIPPSTTITGGPAIRPTSELPPGSTLTQNCPVYFYACLARYGGGCCQTGRDCKETSCPPTQYTTIIDASQTIVVPVGEAATVNVPTGVCASGWQTCAPEVGGNCCPGGYECGTASCTLLSASQTAVAGKNSPSSGGGMVRTGGLGAVMAVTGAIWALL